MYISNLRVSEEHPQIQHNQCVQHLQPGEVAEHVLQLVALDHRVQVHRGVGGVLKAGGGTEEAQGQQHGAQEEGQDADHCAQKDRKGIRQGLHDKGVFGRVVEVLDETKVGEHATETTHVFGDVKTKLLFENEEKCTKHLDDIPKEGKDRPISEKLSFITPSQVVPINLCRQLLIDSF